MDQIVANRQPFFHGCLPFQPVLHPPAGTPSSSRHRTVHDEGGTHDGSDATDASRLAGLFGRAPPLAPREELELARCCRAVKDVPRDTAAMMEGQDRPAISAAGKLARDRLVLANIRLVLAHLKRQVARRSMALDDLVQDGIIGLLHAVDAYDPERGCRFTTYARWWIHTRVTRSDAYRGGTIRVPPIVRGQLRLLRKEQWHLFGRLGRFPTEKELAAELRCKVGQVNALLLVPHAVRSLDRQIGGGQGRPLHELIATAGESPVPPAERNELRPLIRRALGVVSSRSREILIHRFGLFGRKRKSLQWVGNKLGITRERVRQIQKQALEKIAHSDLRELLRSYAAEL